MSSNQVAEASVEYLVAGEGVAAGYKQSEVGIIPEDWEVRTLKELMPKDRKITYGIVVPGPFVSGGTPLIRAQDYSRGWVDISKFYRVSLEIDQSYKRSKVIVDDVLMTIVGSVGNVSKVPAFLDGANITQQTARLSFDTKVAHPVFFLNVLKSNVGKREIENYLKSGVQPSLNLSDVDKFNVPYPALNEQTAIANALSDVDALINGLEKLITKKQAIKTATMQQLLTGRTRLPQFALREDGTPKGYKPSELGEVPEDWEVKTIGQFTDCTAGGTPSTQISTYWDGTHRWMSSGELHLRQVYDVAARITDEGLANSSTKYIPKDSVLMGLAGQGKTRGTVAISRISLCTNQSIAAIFPSEDHSTEYLYYNLDRRYEELRGLSTGDGGRGGLNLTIIRNLKLPYPSVKEQTAIATILSDMDEEIQTLQQRLSKTRQIKQGMMQELLTGKTRLIKPVQGAA